MRLLHLTVPALLLLAGGAARAAGNVVETTRTVGDFKGVAAGAGIQVKIVEGAPGPIGVRGEEDAIAHLRLEVKDGMLHAGYEPNSKIQTDTPTQLAIRMPRVNKLAVSGGARLESSVPCGDDFGLAASGGGQLRIANTLKPRKLALNASGGARVSIAGVETPDATIAIDGAAKVTIAGRADNVTLNISGAAGLDAAALTVSTLQIAGSGGAEASVKAARAGGALSGGARLHVPASAQVGVAEAGGAGVSQDL